MTATIKDRGRQTFITELSKRSSITELKDESDYDKILKEWELYQVFSTPTYIHNCICGQSLKNVCKIKNTITNKICLVGTDCSEKIMGRDYSEHFKKSLKQDFFIWDFEETMNEYYYNAFTKYELGFLKDIEEKILTSIRKSQKDKNSWIYSLSEKQTNYYYTLWSKFKAKAKANPIKLPILTNAFDLYKEDKKKTLLLLESNSENLYSEVFNPVLFSYLVYKKICTEDQYNKYYSTSRYLFKKHTYPYIESNEKLQQLINNEITTLKDETE